MGYSPDGKHLAVGPAYLFITHSLPHRKRSRSMSHGTLSAHAQHRGGGVRDWQVGMTNGGMSIMDGTTLAFVKWVKTFESAVADVKFSPDGEYLAAASHDLFIDVFSVSKGYTKLGTALACAEASSKSHDRPPGRCTCGTQGCRH